MRAGSRRSRGFQSFSRLQDVFRGVVVGYRGFQKRYRGFKRLTVGFRRHFRVYPRICEAFSWEIKVIWGTFQKRRSWTSLKPICTAPITHHKPENAPDTCWKFSKLPWNASENPLNPAKPSETPLKTSLKTSITFLKLAEAYENSKLPVMPMKSFEFIQSVLEMGARRS